MGPIEDDEHEFEEEEEEEQSSTTEKWKKHYSSKHKILFVGEGDFSFSLSLAKAFGSAHNLVATSLDSQGNEKRKEKKKLNFEPFSSLPISLFLTFYFLAEKIEKKYSNGISNARELEEMGCIVVYDVDVKVMSQHFFLKTQRFDRIVYNFPHVGFLYPENSHCQIQ